MIEENNKNFMTETFGIDCDKYSDSDLERMLNNILNILDNKIKELTKKNVELEKRIYILEESNY